MVSEKGRIHLCKVLHPIYVHCAQIRSTVHRYAQKKQRRTLTEMLNVIHSRREEYDRFYILFPTVGIDFENVSKIFV